MLAGLALAFLATPSAAAATLSWWATGSSGVAGGSGTWDTTNARWTETGTSWQAWNNATNDTAVFGGTTAGTVTLGSAITANSLTFETTGYTITAGTLTLAGTTPTITMNTGVAGTITSLLAGSAGLTKTGAGTLTLTGGGSWTGATEVASGSLVLQKAGGSTSQFTTSGITVRNGATLGFGTFDNFGNATTGSTPTITIDTGGKVTSAPGNTLTTILGVTFNGGTLECAGGDANWGAFNLGAVTVIGSSASAITTTGAANSRFNLRSAGTTFDVADVTGNADADLVVSAPIGNGPTSTAWNPGSLVKTGAGTLTLSAANTYTGNTTINAGTLAVGPGGGLYRGGFRTSVVTVGSGATLELQNWQYNETSTASLGGLRANTESMVVNGGTIRIVGTTPTAFFRGATVNSGGATLEAGAGVTWTIEQGDSTNNFAYNGNPTITLGGSGTGTFQKVLANGTGGLVKTGAGTWTLSGTNTYTGTTTVSDGVLRLGVANALANASSLAVNGGGFDLNGNDETVAAVTLSSGSIFGSGKLTAATYGLSGGTVTGNLGSGTVTVTGNSALNGTSDATTVNLNSGTLTLGGGSRFTSSSVAVSGSAGASIVLGGNEAFGSLAGAANVALGSSALSVGAAGTSTTYSGVLSGAGSLTKTGAGKLEITAAQLHVGNTVITGGTLALSGAGSLAASDYIQAGTAASPGGVFDVTALGSGLQVASGQKLGGYGTVLGDVTIAGGAVVSPGGSIGTLTNLGTETWGANGRYLFEITNAGGTTPGTDWDVLNVTALSITATSGIGNQFVIDLQSLTNGSDDVAGAMAPGNWDPDTSYQWQFLVASNTTFSAANFDSSWFTFVETNFLNTRNGTFSVAYGGSGAGGLGGSTNDNELYIVYAAVPEPTGVALAGIGMALAAWGVMRRRRTARRTPGSSPRPAS